MQQLNYSGHHSKYAVLAALLLAVAPKKLLQPALGDKLMFISGICGQFIPYLNFSQTQHVLLEQGSLRPCLTKLWTESLSLCTS